ncbi:MAG: hypothetical protein ACFFBD_20605 [Candidatus Hodarchaeota archaeon]
MNFRCIFNVFLVSLILLIGSQTFVYAQTGGYVEGPRAIGSWTPRNSLDSVEGVALNGDFAYLAVSANQDNSSYIQLLDVFDVTDPSDPHEADPIEIPLVIMAILYANNKIYVGAGSELKIFNVRDPMAPFSVANLSQHSTVCDVVVVDPYIYIADHSGSLMIANESGNLYPCLSFANDYWCFGIFVSGNYAYTATGSQGLVIWDVSNKTSPTIVGTGDTGDNVYSIAPYGADKAVLGGRAGYVAVFDITSKTDPTLLGEIDITSDINEIKVSGDSAIVADYTNGIVTLDLSTGTPTQNKLLYPTGNRGYAVEIDGQYIYGGMGFSGLMIWDLEAATSYTRTSVGFSIAEVTLIGLGSFLVLVFYHKRSKK